MERVRRARVLALADHALRVWARRGLELLDGDATVAGLDSLGRVLDEPDAGYAAVQLSEYTGKATVRDGFYGEDLDTALRQVRKTLEHSGRMPNDWEHPDAATEAVLATEAAAQALAEAFLTGIVTAVAAEAAAVARALDRVR